MKKAISLLTAIFIIQLAYSQYHPIVGSNRTWKMTSNGIIQYFFNDFFQGDTLVNNTAYKKLYSLLDYPGLEVYNMVGMLREDEAQQRVFFFDGNEEFLLFDFDVQVNDFLNVYGMGTLIPVTVESIETVVVNGTDRKKINLNCEFFDMFWIEGVGGSSGLRGGHPGPLEDSPEPKFMCYYEGNDLRWDDPNDESNCGITLGIDAEENALSEIDVYPNPASNGATLSVPSAAYGQRAVMCVINAEGKICSIERIVCGGQNEIDTSPLYSGVYQVMVRFDNGGYTSTRLIVMK